MTAQEYIIRTRHSDGNWSFDLDNIYTRKEAKRLMQQTRVLGGVTSQLWPADEAREVFSRATKQENE
jgi:hypothetical protein